MFGLDIFWIIIALLGLLLGGGIIALIRGSFSVIAWGICFLGALVFLSPYLVTLLKS
jgi:hypothetical protein